MPTVLVLYDRELSSAMMQTLFKIAKNLPKNFKVHVLSLTKEKPDLGFDFEFTYLYDHPIFKGKLDERQILEAQKWLGFPFSIILNGYPFYKDDIMKGRYIDFVAKLVYFWRNFISKNKITHYIAILESLYPHTVGFEVCKKSNVKRIYLSVSRLGGAMMLLDKNFMPIYYKELTQTELNSAYKKAVEKLSSKKPVKMDLARLRGEFHLPDFKQHLLKALDYFIKPPVYRKLTYPNPLVLIERRIIRDLRRLIVPLFYKNADFNKGFFIYPLSFKDEAYNSYFHGIFDQYDIAKQVARALPEGCLLYIKPHPHYCGSDIPISKAIELSKIPNARLISHKISLKELVNKCYGIICVSATTGFEGIVNDKPVFVFGRPFYAVDGTVIFVDNLMELPYLLSKVINDPHYGTSIKSRKNLIAKYYAHQIPLESKPSSNLNMYVTDSEAKEIASHIIQAFEYLE